MAMGIIVLFIVIQIVLPIVIFISIVTGILISIDIFIPDHSILWLYKAPICFWYLNKSDWE
jgi:hypothetical protein